MQLGGGTGQELPLTERPTSQISVPSMKQAREVKDGISSTSLADFKKKKKVL